MEFALEESRGHSEFIYSNFKYLQGYYAELIATLRLCYRDIVLHGRIDGTDNILKVQLKNHLSLYFSQKNNITELKQQLKNHLTKEEEFALFVSHSIDEYVNDCVKYLSDVPGIDDVSIFCYQLKQTLYYLTSIHNNTLYYGSYTGGSFESHLLTVLGPQINEVRGDLIALCVDYLGIRGLKKYRKVRYKMFLDIKEQLLPAIKMQQVAIENDRKMLEDLILKEQTKTFLTLQTLRFSN